MSPLARILLPLVAALLPGGAAAQDTLPAARLKAVKAATVLVLPPGGGSGSGFVARVEGTTAYIITNHHVVAAALKDAAKPKPVTVVFQPAGADERTADAEVLASDPGYDLAVLRVTGKASPPAPLALDADAVFEETTPVLVAGFPFGEMLAAGNKYPAVTIGRAVVSSVRTGPDGDPAVVQLDGSLNPGNSGGPVLTADGRVVGVAVAAILGTRIGLAVPRARLDEVLRGRVAVTAADGAEGGTVAVAVTVADPFRRVKSARVLTLDGRWGEKPPVPEKVGGRWPRLPKATEHRLADWGLTASVSLTRPLVGRPLWAQAEYELTDGTKVRSAPAVFSPKPAEKKPDPEDTSPAVKGNTGPLDAAAATVPPPPVGAHRLADLAKFPDRFPEGPPVVAHGYLSPHNVQFPKGTVGQLTVGNEPGQWSLPITVAVPRAVGIDITEVVPTRGHGRNDYPVRLTLRRVGKDTPNGRPLFAAVEVGFFGADGEVARQFEVDGDPDAFVKEVAAAYAPPPPPTPPTPPKKDARPAWRRTLEDSPKWAVAAAGLGAAGVGVGAAALLAFGRALRRKPVPAG